ncbi:hypothetical protein C0995_015133 [Termitomyces sp. Mi166|nr:hypothetical protein C0995_015133 [Termitomyces sp. Mi166\
MYSDDDLQDETDAFFNTWKGSPYLRLFEEEEESSRREYVAILNRAARDDEEPDATEVTEAIDMIRVWRIERFFATIQGIYKRLFEAETRWNEYEKSFVDLGRHVTVTKRTEDIFGNIMTSVEFIFDDESVWETFKKTWKLTAGISFGFLLYRTKILDMIFRHAQLGDTRMLSSTCRLLHAIGHPHLASNQKIALKLPQTFCADYRNLRSDLLPGDYIATALTAARSDTMTFCNFLESRQDLLDQIRHLYVQDQWEDSFGETLITAHPPATLENEGFYTPLYKSISRIVFSSSNLLSVALDNLMLTLDFIVSICYISKLERLSLRNTNVATEAQHALETDIQGTYSSTVRHLEILTKGGAGTSRYAMLFCPKLVSLVARPGVVQAKIQLRTLDTLDEKWDPNASFGYWLLPPLSADG